MSGISDRNPFVGPRPIQQGESLFGRSTEVRELYNRLQARRIVVLHAPSGAGKSSLVQAGLIPKLADNNFDVWKPIRVDFDPSGLADIPAGTNRYLLSALLSLEEELPAQHRRSPAAIAGCDFLDYLARRPRRKGYEQRSVVLVFDQFEQVLTVAPWAVAEKQAFFTAVGQALDTQQYWALFVIREDYLAALAPYRDFLPTQLSNTFRLDLLGLEGAREAAEQLALQGGRKFPGVDQLVRDLSTIRIQHPDGRFVTQQGAHVEPVQLQVVGRRLWEAMPADQRSIGVEDIAKYADVSKALGSYYAEMVGRAARGDPAVERAVREWVGNKLIVGGIRSQIRQGMGQSAGLDNGLIEQMLSCYLVRTEQRAGANWFELSHDRLVEPVLEDNQAWEQAHLHPMQVQARLWEGANRMPALLLTAEALAGATAWAASNAAFLTEAEQEFLEQSRERRAKERAARRRLVALAVLAVLVAGIVGTLGVVAWIQRSKALAAQRRAEAAQQEATAQQHEATVQRDAARAASETARMERAKAVTAQARAEAAQREATAQRDAAQRSFHTALVERGKALQASLMASTREFLARGQVSQAVRVLQEVHDAEDTQGWVQLAIDLLQQPILRSTLPHQAPVTAAAWSPDGKRIVTVSMEAGVRVWDAMGTGAPIVLKGHQGQVTAAAWSPDGKRIVTGSEDHTVRVWNADGSGAPVVLAGHGNSVNVVAWSPDGKRIVTGSADHTARVWNADGSGTPVVLAGHQGIVKAVAWSPDGKRIVTGSDDHTARVWNTSGAGTGRVLTGHQGAVDIVAWSPDGARIVTGSIDHTARIWDANSTALLAELKDYAGAVRAAAWSPDGQRIATCANDNVVRVWGLARRNWLVQLSTPGKWCQTVAWRADSQRIVTGFDEGTIYVWDADGTETPIELKGHGDAIQAAAWSPDGRHIVTASLDRTACVWNVEATGTPIELKGHGAGVNSVAWSPDGRRIVTISDDRTARVWNADGTGSAVALKEDRASAEPTLWSPDALVAWNPTGKRIVIWSAGLGAEVWNVEGTRAPTRLTRPADVVEAEAVARATARLRFEGRGKPVAWSPDGTRSATLGNADTVLVRYLDGRRAPVELKDNRDHVTSAAWSLDSTRIVTGTAAGTARVWKADGTGTPLELRGHQDKVLSAAWSPDGRRIVTAAADHTARVWLLDVAALRQVLREATTDCLSVEQRQTYLTESEAEARKGFAACERAHGRSALGDEGVTRQRSQGRAR